MMDASGVTLRFAVRGLLRSPAFTAIAVLTLASASARTPRSSAWSTRCCSARWRTREPEQLVSIRAAYSGTGAQDITVSQPEYNDILKGVTRAPGPRGGLSHQHQPDRSG